MVDKGVVLGSIMHYICKLIIIWAFLLYSCPNAILASYASSFLIWPICCSPKLLLQTVYLVVCILPVLSTVIPFSIISCKSWLAMNNFVEPLCLSPPCQWLYFSQFVNQSFMTSIELISVVSPSSFHRTLPLVLLAAASSDFLCCLKQHFPQTMVPPAHPHQMLP